MTDTAAMLERRARLLGPAYRLFYDEPLHPVRGDGVWLFDADGRRYLDAYNNVASVGHARPEVVQAIAAQAAVLNTHTRYLHDGVLNLAERLLATLPEGLRAGQAHAMFTCTGSEANDLALRIARAHTGAQGLIITRWAYHGVTTVLAEASPSLGAGMRLGDAVATVPLPLRAPPGQIGPLFAQGVRGAIASLKARGIQPAALLVDTVFSSDGVLTDPPGFLAEAVAAVREAGGLFIADEVQPGFGRTGDAFWGFARHGLVPDLVTMGKPMGNGHPVAGVVARAEVLAAFGRQCRYFNTFGGNPVAMAAATAVLDVIETEGLQARALRVGRMLRQRLADLAGKHPAIGPVRGAGLFIGLDLVAGPDDASPVPQLTQRVVNGLRQRGVLLSATGPEASTLKIRPPLVFEEEHAALLADTLDAVLTDLRRTETPPGDKTMSATPPDTATLAQAVADLQPWMLATLSDLVASPSPSGAEQPAVAVFDAALRELGLVPERIVQDSAAIQDSPLFSCPCNPDGGRHNLLARHLPPGSAAPGRSVLFNGHLDVVPTGPEGLWQQPPFTPWVADGWLHGRGAGDMKGGLVCALLAYKALRTLGWQPAGIVGFNAVVDEEDTGNGTLAVVAELKRRGAGIGKAMAQARLSDFDAVIIPEPFAETLMSAQVGVLWLNVTLTGRPAHVGYMRSGLNPIEAAQSVMAELKALEAEWNAAERRHPAFADVAHPININLGRIQGGEWNSSVPCTCTMGLRVGFYPGQDADAVRAEVEARIRATAARLNPDLGVQIGREGFNAPGCVYDLDAPAMQALTAAHQAVNGQAPEHLACTATTDGRHFRLLTDIPVTNYGPRARNIHGLDEAVDLASMQRVATVLARYIVDWCGVVPV